MESLSATRKITIFLIKWFTAMWLLMVVRNIEDVHCEIWGFCETRLNFIFVCMLAVKCDGFCKQFLQCLFSYLPNSFFFGCFWSMSKCCGKSQQSKHWFFFFCCFAANFCQWHSNAGFLAAVSLCLGLVFYTPTLQHWWIRFCTMSSKMCASTMWSSHLSHLLFHCGVQLHCNDASLSFTFKDQVVIGVRK